MRPPAWRRAWIVAGGPSARKFDLGRLRGETVLAVNDALDLLLARRLPPTAVASLDNNWIRRRRADLERFEGEKYLALPLETWPDCAGIRGATYLRWSHADGLSEDPTRVCTGGNSGYGALNVAYLKGAREIFLVGYDMDPRDGPAHATWARLFRATLPQLAARRARVVNLNPNSFIDAFPREGEGA